MKAEDLVNFNMKPKVYISDSKISGADKGLFVNHHIAKGDSIVVYYGNKMSDVDIYNLYTENAENYYAISDYIRGTPNGFAINGNKNINNLNLAGVYVNDVASISCNKNDVSEKILREYAMSYKLCNLKVVDTMDYPVYMTTQRVKKHAELYVHYGIGYWLSHIGCTPDEISLLNTKYNFDSFYPTPPSK